jgi:hypothetical protein
LAKTACTPSDRASCGNLVAGAAVHGDEARPRLARQRAQRLVQLHQRLADELHPPVLPRQAVQDVGVEHEGAMHLAATAQRVVQGGVVVHAQVPPKPHESCWIGLFHRLR